MDGGPAGGATGDPPDTGDTRVLGSKQDFSALIAHFLAVYHVPAIDVRGPPLGVTAGVPVGAVAAGDDDFGAVQSGVDSLQKRRQPIVDFDFIVARLRELPHLKMR